MLTETVIDITPELNDVPPEAQALVPADAQIHLRYAREVTIVDDESYRTTSEVLLEVKAVRREIKAKAEAILVPIRTAQKQTLALRDEADAPFEEAEALLKRAIATWDTEQEMQAAELAARLQAEQDALEAQEREREAAALERAGEVQAAERVLASVSFSPAVVIAKATPKVRGITMRSEWKAELVGNEDAVKFALAKAIAAGTVPVTAININLTFVNAQARALKNAFKIPGFRAVCVKSVAAGGR